MAALTAAVTAPPRRVKNFHQRSSQFEQILKKNEQMFALLALTAGLCPAATRVLDESVLNLLQDKCDFGTELWEKLCIFAMVLRLKKRYNSVHLSLWHCIRRCVCGMAGSLGGSGLEACGPA